MYSRGPFYFYWATLVVLVLVLLMIWIPGLGGASGGLRPSGISGKVTYNGKPLTRGAIIFMPHDRRGPDWAAAQLDQEGKFKLEDESSGNEPLAPGRYEIFFVFRDRIAAEAKLLRQPSEAGDGSPTNVEPAPEPSPIPVKYTKPETSGLWMNLGREPNRIVIELKD